MRYTYKVKELGKEEIKDMEAMSKAVKEAFLALGNNALNKVSSSSKY